MVLVQVYLLPDPYIRRVGTTYTDYLSMVLPGDSGLPAGYARGSRGIFADSSLILVISNTNIDVLCLLIQRWPLPPMFKQSQRERRKLLQFIYNDSPQY